MPYRRYRPGRWSQITARYAGTGSCGHVIAVGDAIGWNGARKMARCAECQRQAEYAERAARAYDETGSDCSYDY